MARLISVYRFLAASNSLLNYLTWYHHATYFKKITKASHKPDYPYEMKKKPRKLQFSTSLWKISELPSLLAQMKKQNPSIVQLKKIHGLPRYLLEITSSDVFMSGYQALKCITIHHGYCEFFCMKTLSFANKSNNILEILEIWNDSFEKQ